MAPGLGPHMLPVWGWGGGGSRLDGPPWGMDLSTSRGASSDSAPGQQGWKISPTLTAVLKLVSSRRAHRPQMGTQHRAGLTSPRRRQLWALLGEDAPARQTEMLLPWHLSLGVCRPKGHPQLASGVLCNQSSSVTVAPGPATPASHALSAPSTRAHSPHGEHGQGHQRTPQRSIRTSMESGGSLARTPQIPAVIRSHIIIQTPTAHGMT